TRFSTRRMQARTVGRELTHDFAVLLPPHPRAKMTNPTEPNPEPSDQVPAQESKPKTSNGPDALMRESIWDIFYPRNIDSDKQAVLVASFPMIIYFWPTMFTFLSCAILQGTMNISPNMLGWWASASLLFNLLVIVTDLNQKKFMIALLSLLVGGLLLYISSEKEFSFVGDVGLWISSLEMSYSTHVYSLIGGFLFLFMGLGALQPRMNYWRFEPNEFTHYLQPWGRDQSVPRQGSTVTREIPDVLELLLTFGGGTLLVRRENQVVARIEHVPFLGRRMKAIERMLGVTRVRTMD
ncbi:MAG: hypothetical protein OSB10_11445, partial [Planctomycetota bacterium]|nr:hypothetical protein [Planctomycetota bacterium]